MIHFPISHTPLLIPLELELEVDGIGGIYPGNSFHSTYVPSKYQKNTVFQIFDAITMVSLCAFSGAGDTKFSMQMSVGAAWLVKLPVGYLLGITLGFGAAGTWLGLTLEILVIAIISLFRARGSAWQLLLHVPEARTFPPRKIMAMWL